MNLNLKNRTIFSKIFLGFILIFVLNVFMSGVLFHSLKNIGKVLNNIVGQSIPCIKYPTGVERYALKTILDEKNYLLLQDKKVHRQAMGNIQAIYDNLDKVNEVAVKYNDEELFQKSKIVRQAVETYQGCYNQGVVLLEENQGLAFKMRMLGRKMEELLNRHAINHRELLEEYAAKSVYPLKNQEAFQLSMRAEKEALEIRRHEKNYLLYKKQAYFDKLREHIDNLMKLYEKINRLGCVDVQSLSLVAESRQATEEYLAAAEKWIVNNSEVNNLLAKMSEIGIDVQRAARAVQEAGWQKMQESEKTAAGKIRKAFISSVLIGISVLIVGFLSAFFIARGISQPIKELAQSSDKLARGDFYARVKIKTRDEVGFLSRSFNKMVENLRISQEKIQAQNEELIVYNEELKAVNEELKQSNEEMLSMSEELRAANEDIRNAKEAAEKKAVEFERFNKVAVGRELKMIELKKRIKKLEEKFEESE